MMKNNTSYKTPKFTVALGVSGSIAAYKSAEIASRLTRAGVDVHVIMTENAARLVQPLTFQTISRNNVTTGLWNVDDWRPQHIALAERIDLMVVAPATANVLAKMANGIADDALSTFALSHDRPVIVCPAMNPKMWAHPATRANVEVLKNRGVRILGPAPGRVACGDDTAPGRMSEPDAIVEAVLASLYLSEVGLEIGQSRGRALITAGPTREAIDPVRFLSNRSSGKMGYALAAAAVAAGYETTLISGTTALTAPAGAELVQVESAAEMADAVHARFADSTLVVMTAAVADYRPASVADRKLKKSGQQLQLRLEATEDILLSLVEKRKDGQVIVGFAAETENLEKNALSKMQSKKLDLLVGNDVSRADIGFAVDENEVVIYSAQGQEGLPRMSKTRLAAEILKRSVIN